MAFRDPYTSPLKPALNLRSSKPTVFVTNTKSSASFTAFRTNKIEDASWNHENIIVSCLMEKDSIKELMRKVGQKIDLFADRVSFISGQEASSCQFPYVLVILDESVSNAPEVELIMSRANLIYMLSLMLTWIRTLPIPGPVPSTEAIQ